MLDPGHLGLLSSGSCVGRVQCVKNVALLFSNALRVYVYTHAALIKTTTTRSLISVLLVTTALTVHKGLWR